MTVCKTPHERNQSFVSFPSRLRKGSIISAGKDNGKMHHNKATMCHSDTCITRYLSRSIFFVTETWDISSVIGFQHNEAIWSWQSLVHGRSLAMGVTRWAKSNKMSKSIASDKKIITACKPRYRYRSWVQCWIWALKQGDFEATTGIYSMSEDLRNLTPFQRP